MVIINVEIRIKKKRERMKENPVTYEIIEKAADIFKGFGNPVRIRIINALKDKELRIKDIAELLGYEQPVISQQIKVLKLYGIVKKIRKEEGYRYKLANPHFSKIIKCMRTCLDI